jgi:putative holliday junction resolvase
MRILGVDLGARRIGLALSDDTATLARPWQTIEAGPTPRASADAIARILARGRQADDDEAAGVGAIVVGLPRRLNGDDTTQSQPAREFAAALAAATGFDVRLQDERLSSVEAESRLALREKDWRRRKAKLDAAAAAVILQDYLDQFAGSADPAS